MKIMDTDKFITTAENRADQVLGYLYDGLSTKVYDGDADTVIHNIKTVLDLKSLIKSLYERGTVTISNLNWNNFYDAATAIDSSCQGRRIIEN